MSGKIASIELTDAHNILRLSVEVDSIASAFETMREYGARGWTSAPVPAGGYTLPYCMAETFDFALIGAREFTMTDKESGEDIKALNHCGFVYKRRDEPAVTKGPNKMPARIWYSRGAKAFDNVSKYGDAISYVCLISFVGNGPSIAQYEKPKAKRAAPEIDPVEAEERAHANRFNPVPQAFDRTKVIKGIFEALGFTKASMSGAEMATVFESMSKVMERPVKNLSADDHKGGMSDASLERYIHAMARR